MTVKRLWEWVYEEYLNDCLKNGCMKNVGMTVWGMGYGNTCLGVRHFMLVDCSK